ncbi:hypothetical protein GCM10027024_01090 [Microbacterium insulae]
MQRAARRTGRLGARVAPVRQIVRSCVTVRKPRGFGVLTAQHSLHVRGGRQIVRRALEIGAAARGRAGEPVKTEEG